jgi:PAS domain S-box-containing protein
LAFVLVVLLPMVVIGIVIALSGAEGARQNLNLQQDLVTRTKAKSLAVLIAEFQTDLTRSDYGSGISKALEALYETPHASHLVDPRMALADQVAHLRTKANRFECLSIWDRNGRPIARSGPDAWEGPTPTQPQPSASLAALPGGTALFVSVPLVGPDGRFLGSLGARAQIAEIQRILDAPEGLGLTGRAFLLTQDRVLLTALSGAHPGERLPSDRFANVQGLPLSGPIQGRSQRGSRLNGSVRFIPELQASLVTEQDQAEMVQVTLVHLAVYAGLAVAAIVVALFAALSLTHRISAPLIDLTEIANQIAAGNLEVAAPVAGLDEVGQLARSFNTMTAKVRENVMNLEVQVQDRTRNLCNANNLLQVEVAERKVIEEELQRSQEKLAQAMELAEVVSWELDLATGLLACNTPFFRFHGTSLEQEGSDRMALATYIHEFVHPDDQPHVSMAFASLQAGEPARHQCMEHRMVRRDGAVRYLAVRFETRPSVAGPNHWARGTHQDITNRKQAEADNALLQAKLHEAHKMESLGVLSAGVAHNINNVLAAIMVTASMREELSTNPGDLDAYKTIGKACQRGREVVKSLNQFSRPTPSKLEPFLLHQQIQEVCALLTNTTRNRIQLYTDFASEPIWMRGDSANINHSILNLCLNAVDAMPEGGSLSFRTEITAPDWAELTIKDTGHGMSPEVLSHALEPFYTTKPVNKGTGLGLSITYGVIKTHGGTLEIESSPGNGTSVRIRLPRIQPLQKPAPDASATSSINLNSILIVDDDDCIRTLLVSMLRLEGIPRVEAVSSGESALHALATREVPDLVILDHNMPGLSGTQTLDMIRLNHSELPVLMASGQPDVENWPCFQRPNVAAISKPFTLNELRTKLCQLKEIQPGFNRD